jgi:hypothetical protein
MSHEPADGSGTEFESLAAARRSTVLGEVWRFAMQTRKWWMVPLVVILLCIGVIIILGGTAAAPFIYTLF